MDVIYAQAEAVMVLDAGLMSIFNPHWSNRLIAHLISCSWATRSWCFQEGALATCLVFHFKNRLLSIKRRETGETFRKIEAPDYIPKHIPTIDPNMAKWLDLTEDAVQEQSDTYPKSSMSGLTRRLRESFPCKSRIDIDWALLAKLTSQTLRAREPRLRTALSARDFTRIWNLLARTYTTMPEDVPLIFATLLDLQVDPLLSLNDSKAKMKKIICSFDRLPLALLFLNAATYNHGEIADDWWIPSFTGHELLDECGGMPGLKVTSNQRWNTRTKWGQTNHSYTVWRLTSPLGSVNRLVRVDQTFGEHVLLVTSSHLPEEARSLGDDDTTYIIIQVSKDRRRLGARAVYLYPLKTSTAQGRKRIEKFAFHGCRPVQLAVGPSDDPLLLSVPRIQLCHTKLPRRLRLKIREWLLPTEEIITNYTLEDFIPTDKDALHHSGIYSLPSQWNGSIGYLVAAAGMVLLSSVVLYLIAVEAQKKDRPSGLFLLCIPLVATFGGATWMILEIVSRYRNALKHKMRFEKRRRRLIESRRPAGAH